MIYSFWLFDRHSECVFRREWHVAPGSVRPKEMNDDTAKLIFGIVLSLRNITRKLTDNENFLTYSTSQYKLHYFETASNLKFVMLTDLDTPTVVPALQQIYATLYVEYVVKNPLSPIEHPGGVGINNEMFSMGLDALVRSLPGYV